MPDTILLIAPTGASPDWQAARAAVDGLDELGQVDDLAAGTWPQYDILAGDDVSVSIAVLPILTNDVDTIEEALNTPPAGLSTATCDDGTLVHVFDEGDPTVDAAREAADRLHDFGILSVAGLTRGTW